MASPDLIIYCLLSFIAGILATFIFQKFLSSESRQNRDVERHLQESQDQLKSYQQEVSDHFQQSAKLVDQLTESYREVHNHLAEGAHSLLDTTVTEPVLKSIPARDKIDASTASADTEGKSAVAPLDYAPKRTPYDRGMLDESFGLDKTPPPKTETAVEEPPRAV